MDPRLMPVDGSRLTALGPGIWGAERELLLGPGIRVPIRMVAIVTRSREVLCYSPVSFDDATAEALAGLGDVRWLLAPNRSHRLFLAEAMSRYPRAAVLGSPDAENPPGALALEGTGFVSAELEYFSVHAGPRFTEVVLYHDASETLVLCDLVLNFRAVEPRLRWLLRANGAWGRPSQSRLQRWLLFRDAAALADFYHWAMARPFRQITVAHGPVIRDQAREWLYRLFSRYLTNGAAAAR